MFLSEGTVVSTQRGYIKIEDLINSDINVLTEQGFAKIKITEVPTYDKQCVKLVLWSFYDQLIIPSDNIAFGINYHRCLDLGSVGPCLCKPYNRCWDQCPNDHPEKIHISSPKDLSFRDIRKNGYLLSPKTGNIVYSNNLPENKKFYEKGYNYGKKYKDLLDIMPLIDIEYNLYSDPYEFFNFIKGWQDSMGGVTLDMWNYRFVLKNKELAYQIQFLLNYFGTPCAMADYHSNVFGDKCYLLEFCKYKKPFHYKTWDFNNYRYITVKKWTPLNVNDQLITTRKWYKIESYDNEIKYICCPFLCRI